MVIVCSVITGLLILRLRSVMAKDMCEKSIEGNHCVKLDNRTCLDGNLTYDYTSYILVSDYSNVRREMKFWENLKYVPKCWDVVRPVLCAIYLPRCDYDIGGNKSLIQLPRKKMCDFMRGPCKIVEELSLWPDHLFCNYSYYAEGCHDSAADIKFASTSSCQHPLIKTNNAPSWYPGFEGCSFNCQSPWYTIDDHNKVHLTVFALCLLCIACNIFVLFTFAFNWKHLSNFPDIIILYMNVCYMVSSFGWLFQFFSNLRKVIVCKSDGTTKRVESQFKSDESMLCVIVFIIIYFFTLASVAWLVVLSYTWQIAFETSRSQVNKKKAYFHLGVWVISIVLTVLCLAFTEIDGDSLTGICFISSGNFLSRGIFVLMPLILSWIFCLTFLLRGLLLLQNMKSQSPDLLSWQKKAKLRSSIVRIGIFIFALIVFGITTLGLQIHVFVNFHMWMKSMREFIVCSSIIAENNKSCLITNKPSVTLVQLSVSCHFGFGILLSSWLWRPAAIKSWKTFFLSKFDPSCVPFKHKGDMDGKEQKKNFFSTVSETDDLIGMDFDLNSMTSFDVSSISSILTSNRRHSDSDVSSFEKRISSFTKNFEPIERCVRSNRESFLSSSDWSGSESQKSHYSIKAPFSIKSHYDLGNQSLTFDELHTNKQGIVSKLITDKSIASFSVNIFSSEKKSTCLNLLFDLSAFRTQTMTIYDNFEDIVSSFRNKKEILGQRSFKGSEDCETLDSSNSNYTLASSDSDIMSIKLNKDCHSSGLSIDSLIWKMEIAHRVRRSCDLSPSVSQNSVIHIFGRKDSLDYSHQSTYHSVKDFGINMGDTFVIKSVLESIDGDESGNVSDSDFEVKKNSRRWTRRKRFMTLNKI